MTDGKASADRRPLSFDFAQDKSAAKTMMDEGKKRCQLPLKERF